MDRNHIIDLANGRFDQTTASDMAGLFKAFADDTNQHHMLAYFHGGLVGRESGIKKAKELLPIFKKGSAYPAFFIWNSDLQSTITHNLEDIVKEAIFQRIVRRVARYVVAKFSETRGERGSKLELSSWSDFPADLSDIEAHLDGIQPIALPVPISQTQEQQFEAELKDDKILKQQVEEIVAGLRTPEEIEEQLRSRGRGAPVRCSTDTLMSPSVLREVACSAPDPSARGFIGSSMVIARVAKILKEVVVRFIMGRDHGVYTTVVEETLRSLYLDNVGGAVWDKMKEDTADAFGDDPTHHAGTAFVNHLREIWTPEHRVTLVGHSTGAIFITYFLEHADKVLPGEFKFDVVFLAPACSFPFIDRHIDVYRRRVAHIRSFALNDEIERGYFEIPVLYKGSLLYLVSGLLEENEVDMPIMGMQRYFSGDGPYDRDDINRVKDFLGDGTVWSPAEQIDGRKCTAKKHGGFDTDLSTLQSLKYILESGF